MAIFKIQLLIKDVMPHYQIIIIVASFVSILFVNLAAINNWLIRFICFLFYIVIMAIYLHENPLYSAEIIFVGFSIIILGYF